MVYKNAARRVHKPLGPSEWETIEQLYLHGKTDLQISAIVGCSSKTIARWRWSEKRIRNDRGVDSSAPMPRAGMYARIRKTSAWMVYCLDCEWSQGEIDREKAVEVRAAHNRSVHASDS